MGNSEREGLLCTLFDMHRCQATSKHTDLWLHMTFVIGLTALCP